MKEDSNAKNDQPQQRRPIPDAPGKPVKNDADIARRQLASLPRDKRPVTAALIEEILDQVPSEGIEPGTLSCPGTSIHTVVTDPQLAQAANPIHDPGQESKIQANQGSSEAKGTRE